MACLNGFLTSHSLSHSTEIHQPRELWRARFPLSVESIMFNSLRPRCSNGKMNIVGLSSFLPPHFSCWAHYVALPALAREICRVRLPADVECYHMQKCTEHASSLGNNERDLNARNSPPGGVERDLTVSFVVRAAR